MLHRLKKFFDLPSSFYEIILLLSAMGCIIVFVVCSAKFLNERQAETYLAAALYSFCAVVLFSAALHYCGLFRRQRLHLKQYPFGKTLRVDKSFERQKLGDFIQALNESLEGSLYSIVPGELRRNDLQLEYSLERDFTTVETIYDFIYRLDGTGYVGEDGGVVRECSSWQELSLVILDMIQSKLRGADLRRPKRLARKLKM